MAAAVFEDESGLQELYLDRAIEFQSTPTGSAYLTNFVRGYAEDPNRSTANVRQDQPLTDRIPGSEIRPSARYVQSYSPTRREDVSVLASRY